MNVTFTTIIDGKEVNITKPLINGTTVLEYNYTSQKKANTKFMLI